MTFPKYAKFALIVCIIALLHQIYWFFGGPQTTFSKFFAVLGILAAIVGIIYFVSELKRED